eukprot:424137_1
MRHSKLTCLWFILSVANALFVNEDHNPPQSLNGSSFNIYYRSICSFRERWLSSAYFLALLKRISLPSGCRDNRLLIGDPAQETVINVLTLDNKFAKQITAQFGYGSSTSTPIYLFYYGSLCGARGQQTSTAPFGLKLPKRTRHTARFSKKHFLELRPSCTVCSDLNQNVEEAFDWYPIIMLSVILLYYLVVFSSTTLYLQSGILYYCLFGAFAVAHSSFVNCTGESACSFAAVSCNETEPCHIYCDGSNACKRSQLYCATNYFCQITCLQSDSCFNNIINCPQTANCSISAPSTNYDKRNLMYSIINCPYNGSCEVAINGEYQQLSAATINCPMGFGYDCVFKSRTSRMSANKLTINGGNGDLRITVIDRLNQAALNGATINCPLNSWNKCDINCTNIGCFAMEVNGKSSMLTINATRTAMFGYKEYGVLSKTIIHCPENDNGQKKCNINVHVNSESVRYDLTGVQIFATNAFYDLSLWCDSECFTNTSETYMICTEDVSPNTVCEMKSLTHNDNQALTEWGCVNTNCVCQPPTAKPTQYPTVRPSYAPTPSPTYKLYESPIIVYVERNGSCDYGYCQNPIDMNHTHTYCNVTADLDTSGPPCASLDYAFDCMRGIGGNHMLCSDKYDKHGAVRIGKGSFNFTNDIHLDDAQFVFQGANAMDTHLIHNAAAIDCEWRCKLAFNALSYTTKEVQHVIKSYDDAQIIFEDVIFYHSGYNDA